MASVLQQETSALILQEDGFNLLLDGSTGPGSSVNIGLTIVRRVEMRVVTPKRAEIDDMTTVQRIDRRLIFG